MPQVNVALFSATDTRLPVMIRALPGSVRDVTTLVGSLKEIGGIRATLVLDRGFVSEENEKSLTEAKIPFVLPQHRDSTRYKIRIHLIDHFFYRKRLIHAGKRKAGEQAGTQVENEPAAYKGKREITPILGSFAAPAGLCPSL